MAVAQVNAYVTRVLGGAGATASDWEVVPDEDEGAAKWTGREPAYYRAARDRVVVDGRTTYVVRHSLTVGVDFGDRFDQDDLLEFTFRGSARQGKVRLKPELDLDEAPPEVRTIRCELDLDEG